MTMFQVALCLIVCCVGVSVIWCAILGWILIFGRRDNNLKINFDESLNVIARQRTEDECGMEVIRVVICANSIAIFYYALVADTITSVAHCCAALMGAILQIAMNPA